MAEPSEKDGLMATDSDYTTDAIARSAYERAANAFDAAQNTLAAGGTHVDAYEILRAAVLDAYADFRIIAGQPPYRLYKSPLASVTDEEYNHAMQANEEMEERYRGG